MSAIIVDPVEAVLNLAAMDADLVVATDGQIAERHRYGQDIGDWAYKSQSLIIQPGGGVPADIYQSVQRIMLVARCYGETPHEAAEVYQALIGFCRYNGRRPVLTVPGMALVYYVVARTAPLLLFDEDLDMPFYQVNLEAEIAENLV